MLHRFLQSCLIRKVLTNQLKHCNTITDELKATLYDKYDNGCILLLGSPHSGVECETRRKVGICAESFVSFSPFSPSLISLFVTLLSAMINILRTVSWFLLIVSSKVYVSTYDAVLWCVKVFSLIKLQFTNSQSRAAVTDDRGNILPLTSQQTTRIISRSNCGTKHVVESTPSRLHLS